MVVLVVVGDGSVLFLVLLLSAAAVVVVVDSQRGRNAEWGCGCIGFLMVRNCRMLLPIGRDRRLLLLALLAPRTAQCTIRFRMVIVGELPVVG